jgi:hypothetical protein
LKAIALQVRQTDIPLTTQIRKFVTVSALRPKFGQSGNGVGIPIAAVRSNKYSVSFMLDSLRYGTGAIIAA